MSIPSEAVPVPTPAPGPSTITSASTLRPRFVVRRENGFTPLIGTTKEEVAERLDREITSGQVQEVDLYEYVGTVRAKRVSEMINVFEGETK